MNFFKGGGLMYGIALGVGASLLFPLASRVLAGAAKPILKETIKGGLVLTQKGKVMLAEAKETFEDLSAESKSELAKQQTQE
jgi:hypothetical protein